MTVETVTGCTARQSKPWTGARLVSGGARGQAHGVAELEVADHLGGQRRRGMQLAAELADDPGKALVQVYALAHQRRARAVHAAMTVLAERVHATAQQVALELLNIAYDRAHTTQFAVTGGAPPRARRDLRCFLRSIGLPPASAG